jgi:hypothetical protein
MRSLEGVAIVVEDSNSKLKRHVHFQQKLHYPRVMFVDAIYVAMQSYQNSTPYESTGTLYILFVNC